uniref:Reverse transcriptase domain-containing protein n=1 Tax=Tanacetum cinerariifolium TaxID=118510 RepID=A0A6L2K0B2_TANCI|nr:hypothetical protein [Tanacetum cinerariifolium]
MADHSQKWHDGSSSGNIDNNSSSEGIAAIVSKLDSLGRDMKKLKENVHAIQVGCQTCRRAHLNKECPINEEVKSMEETKLGGAIKQAHWGVNAKEGRDGRIVYANDEAPIDKTPNEAQVASKEEDAQTKVLSFQLPLDLGASVNVIPKSMSEHLKIENLKKIDMLVEMAYMTKRTPIGIVENILVKIDKFLFPSDFVVMDMLTSHNETMILGRPFLATIHAEIDVFNKEISLGIGDDKITFDMDKKIYNFITPLRMGRSSKKGRILKPDTNTQSAHFCKPVKQFCNGILKVWPTCDPTLKLCNGGNEIYGLDEQRVVKYWYCYLDDEGKSIKGVVYPFLTFS